MAMADDFVQVESCNQVVEGNVLIDSVYTLLAFISCVLALPFAALTYIQVQVCRRLWLRFLQWRHPKLLLEPITTFRYVVDTSRNQGIVTVLLSIRGPCDVVAMERRIKEQLLERRNASGNLVFPFLRHSLKSCWGYYAWAKELDFSVNQHVLVRNGQYRGRPVSESTAQEYISETVAKFLPPELSPWQVVVLPIPAGRTFILVRVHHLLLTANGSSLLTELLRLLAPGFLLSEDDENLPPPSPPPDTVPPPHPLLAEAHYPAALLTFCKKFWASSNKMWDDFVSSWESPGVAANPDVVACFALSAITMVEIFRKMFSRKQPIFSMVVQEVHRRNFGPMVWLRAFTPSLLVMSAAKFCWWWLITLTVRLPMLVVGELCVLVFHHEVSSLAQVCELGVSALLDTCWLLRRGFLAPRVFLGELLQDGGCAHALQATPTCGRKVVAWSQPVAMSLVRRVAQASGASTAEVLLAGVTASLREYLRGVGGMVPPHVLCTARLLSAGELVGSGGGGVLCLALPTRPDCDYLSHSEAESLAALAEIRENVASARARQELLYHVTGDASPLVQMLPSPLLRLLLNMMSRRYSVTVTHAPPLADTIPELQSGVDSVIYWRPPQSNVCVSLTLAEHGGSVQLGVMTDALLSPYHTFLATAFPTALRKLASCYEPEAIASCSSQHT